MHLDGGSDVVVSNASAVNRQTRRVIATVDVPITVRTSPTAVGLAADLAVPRLAAHGTHDDRWVGRGSALRIDGSIAQARAIAAVAPLCRPPLSSVPLRCDAGRRRPALTEVA